MASKALRLLTLKGRLEVATKDKAESIPNFNGSAPKARNWMLKAIGGKSLPSMNMGNTAYDDFQKLEALTTAPQRKALLKILQTAGADPDLAGKKFRLSPTSVVLILHGVEFHFNTKADSKIVSIYGKKKAKRSNIPYYD